MKKFLITLFAAVLAVLVVLCGCTGLDGREGRDGKNGTNVTIDDIYAKYVEEYGDISYSDFLKEYLNYTNDELDALTGLQANINKSLMSGVTILSQFTYSRYTKMVYTGSGAIISIDRDRGDAYVVTNCHVVYDDTSSEKFCKNVRLYLYGQDEKDLNYVVNYDGSITEDDNYRIDAEVIGASITYDIALLKVTGSEVLKRSDAVAAKFSTEEEVYVGESVYAIGNASGEGMSATAGIISKDSEYIKLSLSNKPILVESDYDYYRVMRTTAPINHGNSGGAMYNTRGEIIGIVNAKDETEGVDNMGYALPAFSTKRLLKLMYDNYVSNGNRMSSGGGVLRAYLNIETLITDTYSVFNAETGLAEIKETVRVNSVTGAPANGKLQDGDVIKAVKIEGADKTLKDKKEITRQYQIQEILLSVRKGDTVTVTVERGGTEIDVAIQFDSNSYFKTVK